MKHNKMGRREKMKNKVGALVASLVLLSMMFMVPLSPAVPSVYSETYVSDTNDLWWSGATQAHIDGSGYIVPPSDAVWSNAVFCWEHSLWNNLLNPTALKNKLLYEAPIADWIWKAYQVTLGESYTGDIVFFKKRIEIPSNAFNINANLFIITADNAYYFYVNNGWSGIPDGIANFAAGYNPTNFYYVSDGVNNLGGGTNSVPYETAGNLYPKEAAIPSAVEYWASIETWDISSLLHPGENWLQIVAINEHAPPQGQENNPAGLIYKVEVTYEIPPKYYLTVETDPQGLATIPGEGWYDECTYVDLEAPEYVNISANTRYRFDYWDVDGFSVSGNPIKIHMDKNRTATAHYVKQYYLDVVSPYDTPSGMGWYDEGDYANAVLSYGIENLTPGRRAVFEQWSGDASGTGLISDPIHMDSPKTAIALWKLQCYLTVETDPENVTTIPGEDWYYNCTYVKLEAPEFIPVSQSIRYRFDYWDIDDSVVSGNPIDIHMNCSPHIATAHYVIQYYLTVKTDPEGIIPIPVGEGWYDGCTVLKLRASDIGYLGTMKYLFIYWDVDGTLQGIGVNPITVHMNKNHTATAHYKPLVPHHLDAEPPVLIDLTNPVSTEWAELYPEFSRGYRIESWYDTDNNGILDPSDYIDLWDIDHKEKAHPYYWHIDDVTVTLKVTKKNSTETMYIEFEGGWSKYYCVIEDPVCTQWLEVYPNYGNEYHLLKKEDGQEPWEPGWCDLSPCDQIELENKLTGEKAWYHVDEVKTDLIVSPKATEIILCKTKEHIGEGYPQILPIIIRNYYNETTTFDIAAYYNNDPLPTLPPPLGNQSLTLNPLESGDAILVWNEVATWPKGTYTVTITIIVHFPDCTTIEFVFPITFQISILGDLNGDGKVDMKDIAPVAKAFGTKLCQPRWNPDADLNYDINNDLLVNMKDIAIVSKNFGKTDP
jgi:hypothetical protein